MTLNEYQQQAHTTSGNIVIGHSIVYPTLGLANEAGEFAGKVKKLFRDKDGELSDATRLALNLELGDVLWYLSECATQMGTSLGQIAEFNLAKLSMRKQRGTIHGDGDER